MPSRVIDTTKPQSKTMIIKKRNSRKKVFFRPYVDVKSFCPILDPTIKSQLYYSRNDLMLMKMKARRAVLLQNNYNNRYHSNKDNNRMQRIPTSPIKEQKLIYRVNENDRNNYIGESTSFTIGPYISQKRSPPPPPPQYHHHHHEQGYYHKFHQYDQYDHQRISHQRPQYQMMYRRDLPYQNWRY